MLQAKDAAQGHPALCILAGEDGESRLVDLELPISRKETTAEGLVQWVGGFGTSGAGIAAASSGGNHSSWHVSHRPGLSIVLAGSWEIEASNGQRRLLETGTVLVMLDQHGRGHFSRTRVAPCVTMGIALDEIATAQVRALALRAAAEVDARLDSASDR